jgi:hypothetical protein
MIYTSYEMIRDCRAGKPQGWSYFVATYKPVAERMASHYGVKDVEKALASVRDSLLPSLQPMPERHFMAELRQKLLEGMPEQPLQIDVEAMGQAFAPLTVVEKKAVWLETMRYGAEETGRMLRMDAQTVAKIRDKAAEMLRSSHDRWSRTMLADNGLALGRTVASRKQPECVPGKALLDIIDGRSTWSKREELERHIGACWHCVDHFSRLHEVCDLLRPVQKA